MRTKLSRRLLVEQLERRELLSNYYVSPTGNDNANGSASAPWRTLQRAADAVTAGDTVTARAGQYAGFVLGWDTPTAGTATNPITFRADPAAAPGSVIINARNRSTPTGIDIEPGCDYIIIQGFAVQGGGGIATYPNRGYGIKVTGNYDQVINNTITGLDYGIAGIHAHGSNNALLQGNTITGVHNHGNPDLGHGIYVAEADGVVVLGNTIHDNDYIGIHVNGDPGLVTHALITSNSIYNNGQNGINCDGIQSSTIVNNLIYGYSGYGIAFYQIDSSGPSRNNIIVNNTIVSTTPGAGAAVRILNGGTGNTLLNNTLLGGGGVTSRLSSDSLPGLVSDYNVVGPLFQSDDNGATESLAQWRAQTGQDAHSILATPAQLFVNPGSNNYRLSPTSPAIDAATSQQAPNRDIVGVPRPQSGRQGNGWDIGAYEYLPSLITATAVRSSANPSTFGSSVTFTATVSGNGGTPTGTVTFSDGNTTLGVGTLANGIATFTASLPTGGHTITATYSGDLTFQSSTSDPLSQTISQAGTTVSVVSSTSTVVFGQAVTFTANVASLSGSGTPTGTITFRDGATTLGTATLSSGSATYTSSALAVGSHTITAGYGGDTNFTTSTSGSLTQTIAQATSSTAVASSVSPSALGQAVTFSATVSVVAPGSGIPTGTVTFKDGSTTLGTGTLNNGVATYTTSALSLGSHTITALYGGDINFAGSTFASYSQRVVNQGSSTALTSSNNSSAFGRTVTFTATVSPLGGGGPPTGIVTFKDGATIVGTATLSGGVATYATSTLAVGNHTITAVYGGDSNFGSSTSPTYSQTVTQTSSSTTLTTSGNSSMPGQAVTFSATVSTSAVVGVAPTGTITFMDGPTALGTATLSGGTATLAVATLAVGRHAVTATYSGDMNFPANSSTPVDQIVGTTNQRYVAQVYLDLLKRSVEPGGLATWSGALDRGVDRIRLVILIQSSPEYRALQVQSLYAWLLHRSADASGLSAFTAFLSAGGTLEQVAAMVAGSPEYFQTQGGGSNTGFLSSLYHDGLGRQPDSTGQTAFGQALANGTAPGDVAAAVFSSQEYHQGLVQGFFQQYLRRTADSFGLNIFTQALGTGARDEQIIAVLLGSPEYLSRV